MGLSLGACASPMRSSACRRRTSRCRRRSVAATRIWPQELRGLAARAGAPRPRAGWPTRRCCWRRTCRARRYPFAHAAEHRLSAAHVMLDSYHCSRYNTQTRRLTTPMFRAVLARACELAQLPVPDGSQGREGSLRCSITSRSSPLCPSARACIACIGAGAGAAVRRQGPQPQGSRQHLLRRAATWIRRCRRWCSRSRRSR